MGGFVSTLWEQVEVEMGGFVSTLREPVEAEMGGFVSSLWRSHPPWEQVEAEHYIHGFHPDTPKEVLYMIIPPTKWNCLLVFEVDQLPLGVPGSRSWMEFGLYRIKSADKS